MFAAFDEDVFLHGDLYPNCTNIPRAKMCSTCAFKPKRRTARPSNVSVDDLIIATAEYDDFVCHTSSPDGTNPRCAAWHALNRTDIADG